MAFKHCACGVNKICQVAVLIMMWRTTRAQDDKANDDNDDDDRDGDHKMTTTTTCPKQLWLACASVHCAGDPNRTREGHDDTHDDEMSAMMR